MAQWVKNPIVAAWDTVEMQVQLGLVQWVKGSSIAAAVVFNSQIRSLAQELPYSVGAAIKKKKQKELEVLK